MSPLNIEQKFDFVQSYPLLDLRFILFSSLQKTTAYAISRTGLT